jgi:uncharacterized membrane protein
LLILFSLRAYQLGVITIVAPLSTLSILCNVLLASIFLKEKDNLVKKIVVTIGIIIGIILIY